MLLLARRLASESSPCRLHVNLFPVETSISILCINTPWILRGWIVVRLQEPLINRAMISHWSLRRLVLRARIFSPRIIDCVEIRFWGIAFLSTAEYSPCLNIFSVVLVGSHSCSMWLLACSSSLRYICRICTANFGEQISSWCVWELWTVSNW